MPSIADELSRTFLGLALVLCFAETGLAEEPLRLREEFPAGYQYHVSSRVELSGSLTLPPQKNQPAPKPLTLSGSSAIEYDERILAHPAGGPVQKTLRLYRRIDFARTVGDRPQQSTIRPEVRRLVLLRLNNAEVPFSPDGPLAWGEIDLVRTDVFTPALAGLLPESLVRPGDRWPATLAAIQELTDLERVEEGQVECRLEEITTLEKRRQARIAFRGNVRGINEDGPNRQQLDGYLFFDLESHHISYLSLNGVHFLLDKDGQAQGSVTGRFVLTRQAHVRCPDLSDDAVRGLALEPNADNTLLLYDHPDLGVRFLYPRRWRVAGLQGKQVTLDEVNGSGLLLTLEAAQRVPTATQYLTEARDWLQQQQQAKVVRVEPPQRVQTAPRELDHFVLEIDQQGQRLLMDYYVIRQAQGGATLAARLLPAERDALQKEVERIARSIRLDK